MAYDVAGQHASALIWTLPRTSHQTATALRAGGWTIKDNIVHLFGTGWAKTGNALAPGQEGWLLCTKGKPDLDIDACRVPRGERDAFSFEHGDAVPSNVYGTSKHPKVVGKTTLGSLPKNALLSHCEECVRVGSKRVKGGVSVNHNRDANAYKESVAHGRIHKDTRDATYTNGNGTESTPAFHCLAGCSCGARTPWPDDRPLPRCPCGETWRWLCPVAEVNAQSGHLKSGTILPHHVAQGSANLSLNGANMPRTGKTSIGDEGGAARFFNTFQYLSKCGTAERHAGCENLYWKADKRDPFGFVQVSKEEWETLPAVVSQDTRGRDLSNAVRVPPKARGNVHPTVKSYRLMHGLHTLTRAKRIGDLTGGSGTGVLTAYLDGIDWLGAEMCPQAIVIANARLAFWKGLSFDAREAFMRDDVVPVKPEAKAAQRSLFE
jgi:hypothetical protein